ncbi:hypothetical protein [Orrella marina]|uniref:hypothetical protein n=1 Tax=Orrella marina TaxID=2163011 RepID=UPI00187ECE5A|nr:hypothetical protein [Orrella marina]
MILKTYGGSRSIRGNVFTVYPLEANLLGGNQKNSTKLNNIQQHSTTPKNRNLSQPDPTKQADACTGRQNTPKIACHR